jgi:hypothetical protein
VGGGGIPVEREGPVEGVGDEQHDEPRRVERPQRAAPFAVAEPPQLPRRQLPPLSCTGLTNSKEIKRVVLTSINNTIDTGSESQKPEKLQELTSMGRFIL